ncbi:hypothetical protein FGG08_003438 [Glutinoglossum americanum]|uniref:Uncharacterized protein n=1 Tax=Glutinoglossum americanum TaxID=1670608 RepID=A0A9P8I7A4_9PEZI|nr:hypothetical protein FGG08_003438 [Glutinoglossum americanum]
MSVKSVYSYVVILPNPEWAGQSGQVNPVPTNISFNLLVDNNILTLSSSTISRSTDIRGLLYVPDLDRIDPCVNASSLYIPSNATRQTNLPQEDYRLIAIAPWISADCTLAYLSAARQDPIRAFIFYPLDNGTGPLPPANDQMWGLHDGGQWRSHNKYPVYAVTSQVGNTLMTHLSRYSGNMTDVENGHYLTEIYDIRDYARIYTDIRTGKLSFNI